jgi:LacI family transcriptional regulator
MPSELPTYAEIAKRSRVSIKTVCNFFRTPDIVAKKTQTRVQKALGELGVQDPKIMRERIRPARINGKHTIVLLEAGLPMGSLSSPVFANIVRAAEIFCHQNNKQLLLRHKDPDHSLSQALKQLSGDGVILFGGGLAAADIQAHHPKIAVVRIFQPPATVPDCDQVDYDRLQVVNLAAHHLKQRKCTRVAYIGPHNARGTLFVAAATNLGLKAEAVSSDDLFQHTITSQSINRKSLEKALDRLLQLKPDGVFVYSDQVCNALYSLLAERGIRPQRDLPIISCNGETVFLSPLHPRPPTIILPSEELGRRAVSTLLWRMATPSAPLVSTIIQPLLELGEPSVG